MSLKANLIKAELLKAGKQDKFGKTAFLFDKDIVLELCVKNGSTHILNNKLTENATYIGITSTAGISSKNNILKINGCLYNIDFVQPCGRFNILYLEMFQ